MKATVVYEPKPYRYLVENRWGSEGAWRGERRFKNLDKAKKYADKHANYAVGMSTAWSIL